MGGEYMLYIRDWLMHRSFLILLLIVNVIGTIYGYIWYGPQLSETPPIFLPFVPDSPTASLFFVFVLIAWLRHTNWPFIEALAVVTLVKYGIWAVVMNMLVLVVTGQLGFAGWMLVISHGAMAVQALLYAPYYRMSFIHVVVAAIWTLHNDVIDYVFGMMPQYQMLSQYTQQIGYFTFWLSIVSIAVAYIFSRRH
ncbi:Predicted membrane protein [Anoxybacillus flavithermus WK1]|uniref:Predicted membrane protein n=2 Tax=Anoxybacillus flavithermus TaxID=33934 RepID=B7GHS0_ANOFW|nr:Predicted membrane protein [Anoxybacillus flavithermus WK1]